MALGQLVRMDGAVGMPVLGLRGVVVVPVIMVGVPVLVDVHDSVGMRVWMGVLLAHPWHIRGRVGHC
jgi:hypothetical protein